LIQIKGAPGRLCSSFFTVSDVNRADGQRAL